MSMIKFIIRRYIENNMTKVKIKMNRLNIKDI